MLTSQPSPCGRWAGVREAAPVPLSQTDRICVSAHLTRSSAEKSCRQRPAELEGFQKLLFQPFTAHSCFISCLICLFFFF